MYDNPLLFPMPNVSDKLSRLINAFDETELRAYKKYCHKEHPQQSKQFLFILDNYIKYNHDEEKLSKKIESISHHYVYKHNLYNSMLNYASGEKISELNQIVLKLSWLYNKGLIADALELSNESINEWEAKTPNTFNNTNYLRLLEYNILFRTSMIHSFDNTKELLVPYDKMIQVLENNLLRFKYQKIYYRLFYLSNSPYLSNEIKTELNDIFSDKLLTDISEAKTIEAKRYYHRIFHIKSYLDLDPDKMLIHSKELVSLWEIHKEKNLSNYLIGCFNHLESCFTANNFNYDFLPTFTAFLSAIKKLNIKNKHIEIEYLEYIIYTKLFNKVGKPEEAKKIVESALHHNNLSSLSIDKILKVKYNAAITYFLLKDFKKAGILLDEIISNAKTGFSIELIAFSRLLQEITVCETGKYDYLAFSIDSAKRYFSRYNFYLDLIKTTLKYLKETSIQLSSRERKKVLVEFKEKLIKEHSAFEINRVCNGFDLLSWTDSQVEEKPMYEIIKSKLAVEHPHQADKLIQYAQHIINPEP